MIGYVDGTSPLHRAHPYTTLALSGALLFGAFALTRPLEVGLLVLTAVLFAATGRVLRSSAQTALLLSLPIWILLFVLHGLLGAEPRLQMLVMCVAFLTYLANFTQFLLRGVQAEIQRRTAQTSKLPS